MYEQEKYNQYPVIPAWHYSFYSLEFISSQWKSYKSFVFSASRFLRCSSLCHRRSPIHLSVQNKSCNDFKICHFSGIDWLHFCIWWVCAKLHGLNQAVQQLYFCSAPFLNIPLCIRRFYVPKSCFKIVAQNL